MKKIGKIFFVMLVLLTLGSSLFAVTVNNDIGLDANTVKPLNTGLNILKFAAVFILIADLIIAAIRIARADQQQKQQVLISSLIYTIVCAVIILVAFKLPALLGVDEVIGSDGGAIIHLNALVSNIIPTLPLSGVNPLLPPIF